MSPCLRLDLFPSCRNKNGPRRSMVSRTHPEKILKKISKSIDKTRSRVVE